MLYLFRARHRIREGRRRTDRREVVPDEEPITVIGPAPKGRPIALRKAALAFLQPSTSAQRSRAWLAHEVDGVPVREIARQEWRPAATSYHRIRCARRDLKAALRRDEHSEQFQMTQRQRSK